MHKQPLRSAVGWLGVVGVTMMLALTACESSVIQPTTQSKPVIKTAADDDPPEKPIKPPGDS